MIQFRILRRYRGNADAKHGRSVDLPALPRAFGTGMVSGLRTRAGATVAVSFRDGRLEKAELKGTMPQERELTVCYKGRKKKIILGKGMSVSLTESDF
ncbi:MAG: glycoside hydrolase family 95-like protein [Eisenbergiella sp.]